MSLPKILGVSASLRNARYGRDGAELVRDIEQLSTAQDVHSYIETHAKARAAEYFDLLPSPEAFEVRYAAYRKIRSDRGLSNSEGGIVAGLWAAHRAGAVIDLCGLGAYFPLTGPSKNLDELRQLILSCDGILLSGPVYFGDRGSLAQAFFDFLRCDPQCAAHISGLPFAGIAVGAKRNGGQETTLIYQLLDAVNMNMLGVGNGDETTAQYGGTAVAGDIGTVGGDRYGLETAMGAGRRVATVARLVTTSSEIGGELNPGIPPTEIAVWLLQDDRESRGRTLIERFCREVPGSANVRFTIFDFTRGTVYRCLACDICPTSTIKSEGYRCIIQTPNDFFSQCHEELIRTDALLLSAYCAKDITHLLSAYQTVIERTRYLRRDNYVYGELLAAPLIFNELGSRQNLSLRMLTSAVRHHTILHKPIEGTEWQGNVLNWDDVLVDGSNFLRMATRLTQNRATQQYIGSQERHYRPVGYVISRAKHLSEQQATTQNDA